MAVARAAVRAIAPERLDELARAILAGAAPLRVAVATTSSDIDVAHRLRYVHAVAAGWIRADDHPLGLERDAHDRDALAIVAWDGERPVGTCRVVVPAGRLLPVEEEYGVRVPPAGRAVEWGRVVVTEDHRGDRGHAALTGLLARAWLETRRLGFHGVAGAASRPVIRLYRQIGFDVLVLGPDKEYWGEMRLPVRLATTAPTRRRPHA